MYLKRLEMQGFKSFPEKIRLEFGRGITAVVGPNGSGKSNVSDAVRWVLGEQSAKTLRGGSMQDVIFAGTAARKPLSFAEVTIVLDNADAALPIDYAEISVTRRVFRSGESEFLINGAGCRLKDVHELFMDTGIGRDGYSMIGQGRVEEILDTKSGERRLLFDEAAGIAKYKARKAEAESRLERERANLVRANDIIAELELQLDPLREQSENARAYLNLKERLKLVDVNIFLRDIESLSAERAKASSALEAARGQLEAESARAAGYEAALEALKAEQAELDEAIKAHNEALYGTRSAIEACESGIRLAEEQINHLTADGARVRAELSQLRGQISGLAGQRDMNMARRDVMLADLEARRTELAEAEKGYEELASRMSDEEKLIERYNAEILEQTRLTGVLQGQLKLEQARYERLGQAEEELLDKLEENAEQISQLEERAESYGRQAAESAGRLTKTRLDMKTLTREKAEAEEQARETAREHIACLRRLNGAQARHRLLSEMQAHHEGYSKSVRAVLAEREANPAFSGIRGTVGELCDTSREYLTAVETALGAAVQNIITDTEEDAVSAIEFLKRTSGGRATFLPVTAVKSREGLPPGALSERGALACARDIITCDPYYEDIFGNLLGGALIADTVDNAVAIQRRYKQKLKIVTLAGELLSPGGAMSGGSAARSGGGVFGRAREIGELAAEIADLKGTEAGLKRRLEGMDDQLRLIKARLDEDQIDTHRLELIIDQARQNAETAAAGLSRAMERGAELAAELRALTDESKAASLEIRRRQNELRQNEAAAAEKKALLGQMLGSMSAGRGEKDEYARRLTDIKLAYGGAESRLAVLDGETARLAGQLERAGAETGGLEGQMERAAAGIADKEAEIKAFRARIEELSEKRRAQSGQLDTYYERKAGAAARISAAEEAIKASSGLLFSLNAELARLTARAEQQELDERRAYDAMWEEYNVTRQSAREYPKLEMEYGKLRAEQRRTRAAIQELGDVSVAAIEEYRAVKARYDTLSAQRGDIIEAEAKLTRLIDDLVNMMTERFKERFAAISESFSAVFGQMFQGGKAHLSMSDAENVLESGIDIIAQPPGKALQNMSLLSGGERALTATALLFGILRLKPSPFCVLDEVESALDDANVLRFVNFLKNYARDTQFILITHRKGAMEAADVLYGVTMQERGISKLVSVRLDEAV